MRKNYTPYFLKETRPFKLSFIKGLFGLVIVLSCNIGFSQNVTNMFYSGDLNSFGADAMSFSNNKWQVTLQALSSDSQSTFLFRDSGANFDNKWSRGIAISFGTIETAFWQGGDTDINVTANNHYTFNLSDVDFNGNGELIVQETDNAPIDFAASNAVSPATPTVFPGQDLDLTITLAGNKSSQERVFIRYTNNSFSTSDVVEVSFASATASSGTATIPASFNTAGANVVFYAYSTTVAATSSSNHDLITLNLENNGGSNYSYTVQSSWTTSGGGTNWNDVNSWDAGEIPASGVPVTLEDDLTLNTDATVSSITINNSVTFTGADGTARTLTIEDGGSFTNNGTFTANGGTVSFAAAGTISGTTSTTFNDVDIAGGVDFGSGSTVDGNLTVNAGGFADTNGPTYGGSSTLVFATGGPYTIDGTALLWMAGGTLGLVGVPNNVEVTTTSPLNIFQFRDVTGNLTINSGASVVQGNNTFTVQGDFENSGTYSFVVDGESPLTVQGNFVNNSGADFSLSTDNAGGGDLIVQGNFDDSGTFTSNNRAVFFTGSNAQTVTSTTDPLTIDFIVINKPSNNVQMLQNLDLPNDITLTNGNLDLNGNTLTISGDIRPDSGAGAIDASSGNVIFNSTSPQTIENGDFSGTISILTFNSSGGVTVNTDISTTYLEIENGDHDISTNSVLTLVGNNFVKGIDINAVSSLTFKSNTSGSAQFLNSGSTSWLVNSPVTVERYIPATDRAFRFVASPVTSSDFIFENWQENGSTPATPDGLGTHITGPNPSASNGLDDSNTDNPSMFTFDNTFTGTQGGATNSAWNAVTDTKNTKLEAGTPYLLFVRGDRSIDLTATTTPPANETTLRATGSFITGNNTQTLSSVSEYFSLVANPYQAIVDFNALTFTGIANTNFMYIYDPSPLVKDYVQLNSATDAADMFIKPGQSFFVVNQSSANATTTVQFDQANINTSGAPTTTVFNDSPLTLLKLELYDDNNVSRENLRISFIDNATNGIDSFDGPKLSGDTEVMATINSGTLYSFERRNLVQSTDIVPLHLSNYQSDNYEFKLNLENWDPNIEIFIEDNYLDTTTQIDQTQPYAFSVDSSIPESIAEDRFNIVFDNTTFSVEDNTFGTDFSLYPNPTQNGQFSIKTPNLSGDVQVEITNLLGQQVFFENLTIDTQEVNVNTESLTSGIYVVKLTQNDQAYSTKLMVE